MSFRFVPDYFAVEVRGGSGGAAGGLVAGSVAFTAVALGASLWPDWGKKILRSGRECFARWLSIELPTVPRFRMACGTTFLKMPAGVNFYFRFLRIESRWLNRYFSTK